MNPANRRFGNSVSIAVLATAFLISSQKPLWATVPQSAQSNSSQQQGNSLPDAPQSQPAEPQQQPSGAAGAKAATPKGAPVAQPVGAAVAPPRQRGHRSLIIKLGLLAGGGIAVGSAIALSERSPSRPPGTSANVNAGR